MLTVFRRTPTALVIIGRLLSRRYKDGERLTYLMKGRNNDRAFEVRLTAFVKKRADGQFPEEYAWSDLAWGGAAQPMTPSSRDFRQTVTWAGGVPFAFPDLSRVQPGLIGPVTDLLTVCGDLFLAMHGGQLRDTGDRFLFSGPMAGSWADGTRVLIGEDDIDFDVQLTRVDKARDMAALMVRHVPPKTPRVRIPAEWMRTLAAGVPSNWVQVRRDGAAYIASVFGSSPACRGRGALSDKPFKTRREPDDPDRCPACNGDGAIRRGVCGRSFYEVLPRQVQLTTFANLGRRSRHDTSGSFEEGSLRMECRSPAFASSSESCFRRYAVFQSAAATHQPRTCRAPYFRHMIALRSDTKVQKIVAVCIERKDARFAKEARAIVCMPGPQPTSTIR